ncbi:MAG: tRNA (5-methylaminomethyl-2-thiouridine)(34)-methyltransferase MnmD [Candidatus Omnitrophica bacterium]|nr:tRNA (5-methylaminomethyl-2-thiouridine)(34)-methyltransferase MnmD [Candidatus Omnitrophota bacterium]
MHSKNITANEIRWDDKGVPHSIHFRDKYFCTQNGYEEYKHISGHGNGLEKRFAELDPSENGTFTVIETGFGTGMCFCCIWELWDQFAPKSWNLHFISVELYPLSNTDLDRALSVWPPLAEYRKLLSAQYQPHKNGIHDLHFKEQRVRLTIVFEDVVEALTKIRQQNVAPQKADAWLLNGFSPFANPQMWTQEVFDGMAKLSKPGTTLSTFTVAGHVRRGLEAAGFKLEKIPGYGTKKQMLRGWRP